MTTLRTAAQQVLEVLRRATPADSAQAREQLAALTALRAALAQQDEPVKPAPLKRGITGRCTRKVCECEKEGLGPECIYLEPVIDGYPLWSGIPKAEPVEPVAWTLTKTLTERKTTTNGFLWFSDPVNSSWTALYTAPPQRTMVPLTEEEILAAVGWERAAMYMKLTPNFPVDEAKKETLTNARAVEKAVWEKNHGQA